MSTELQDKHVFEQENMLLSSSKLQILAALLKSFQRGCQKAVIVSQYKETLELIELFLSILHVRFCKLLGSTPFSERDLIVHNFNTSSFKEFSVLLLSSKAGGCGLNLTGSTRLIIYEPSWNPAQDLQALSRIYRSGQKRPVCIYTFLRYDRFYE